MGKARRRKKSPWLSWLQEPVAILLQRLSVVAKAVLTCGVGLLEFASSRVVWRSPWGTIYEDRPRLLGMLLFFWGAADFLWLTLLAEGDRRAWRYLVFSSAGIAVLSLVVAGRAGTTEARRLLVAGAAGAASMVVLLTFSDPSGSRSTSTLIERARAAEQRDEADEGA